MSGSENRGYQFLFDEAGVREDLTRCKGSDKQAYARIVVILEDLRGNPAACELFIDEGWQDHQIEDVSQIQSFQRERINALRVKVWELWDWRLIFLADHRRRRAALVAVMHRSQGYERDKRLWDRIRDAHERLGFEKY